MSAVTAPELVEPHGGSLRPRAGDRPDGVEGLERVTLAPRELADLDMLASGALSPLEGYMGPDDYRSVVEDMHLADGTLRALPVTLAVEEAPRGDVVALTDEAGTPLAALEVEACSTTTAWPRPSAASARPMPPTPAWPASSTRDPATWPAP